MALGNNHSVNGADHSGWFERRLALTEQLENAPDDRQVSILGEQIDELDRLIISTPGEGIETLIIKLETAKLLAAPGGSCILATLDVILSQLREQ